MANEAPNTMKSTSGPAVEMMTGTKSGAMIDARRPKAAAAPVPVARIDAG